MLLHMHFTSYASDFELHVAFERNLAPIGHFWRMFACVTREVQSVR